MEGLYERLIEEATSRKLNRHINQDKQNFGDFVETVVYEQFKRHWNVKRINTGKPEPFDIVVLDGEGNDKFHVEVKAINNDWDLPYFLYEVEDRGRVPCHFGHIMKTLTPASKKEFFVAIDCNLKKGGTLHIYPAHKLAQYCNTQNARSTKVNTRCVEVGWDKDIKGKRTIQLDADLWECIRRWKGAPPSYGKENNLSPTE